MSQIPSKTSPRVSPRASRMSSAKKPSISMPPPTNVQRGALAPPHKVALTPGHSLMDWIRLGNSGKDLTGVGGQVLKVTDEELARHSHPDDIWMALGGKVYNVTPYMDFHPGGRDQLMKAAGGDGTQLFNQNHKWVNYDSMLGKCFVGYLISAADGQSKKNQQSGGGGSRMSSLSVDTVDMPPAPIDPLKNESDAAFRPRMEWFQTNSTLTVVVYTKWANLRSENIIVDSDGQDLKMLVQVRDWWYMVHLRLSKLILNSFDVRVSRPSGKVDLVLQKKIHEQWENIGKPQGDHEHWEHTHETKASFRTCTLSYKSPVTHDTRLFCFNLPKGCYMRPPIGQHVYVRKGVDGMEFTKPYTVVFNSIHIGHEDPLIHKGEVIYLLIKVYPDGTLTPTLDALKEGDTVGISDPEGNFDRSRLDNCTSLQLYAAGTGFTPMVRLILTVLHSEKNKGRSITLVFYNKQEKDIIWRKQMDELSKSHTSFKVHYVLSQPDDNWTGEKGYICADHVRKLTPFAEQDINPFLCVCGPTAFTESAINAAVEAGYPIDTTWAFTGK